MPLYKSGVAKNPENYRPVLPVLSKRSTQVASTLMIDNMRRELDKGKLVAYKKKYV